jgi:hypothetical protein
MARLWLSLSRSGSASGTTAGQIAFGRRQVHDMSCARVVPLTDHREDPVNDDRSILGATS